MKWNVTIFNMASPDEKNVVEVEADTQKQAENYAVSGGLVSRQTGWGVWGSEPVDAIQVNKPHLAETVEVTLTPEKCPVAYERKLRELISQGAFDAKEEAEKWLRSTPIVLELYYDIDSGLFAVESAALEANPASICSPYSKKPFIE